MSTWKLLKSPGVARVVLIFNYVMILAFTFTAVNPVFGYTPIHLGGLGFSAEQIAAFAALGGASQAAWLLLVFPRLHKRVGTGQVLLYCACAWPVFFASNVAFNFLRRHHLEAVFWATAPLTLVLGSGVAMAFSMSVILKILCPLLTHFSRRSTCSQRHRTLAPNPWNIECCRAGWFKWYSRRLPSACD